jgi:ankyrin repeat protein
MPPWFHQMDEQGETPMSRALKSAYPALVRLLVEQEQEYAQERRRTAEEAHGELQSAAYWGFQTAVERLLAGGADPSQPDDRGNTPLMWAVCNGQRDIVTALLDHGADVNAKNAAGLTCLHWVALTGRTDIAEMLVSRGVEVNPAGTGRWTLSPASTALLMGHSDLFDLISVRGGSL